MKAGRLTVSGVMPSAPSANRRLAIAAIAVGAASALAAPAAAERKPSPAAPPTPVVVRTSEGFHWGDAAVGAAAGAGAALTAMGAVTLARNR